MSKTHNERFTMISLDESGIAGRDAFNDRILMPEHVTTLYRTTGHDEPVELEYNKKTLRKSQARFHGRTALVPQIDLNAYQCRSVVDWIEVQVRVTQPTQHQWINEIVNEVQGRRGYVVAQAPGAGKVDTCFTIRLQEPNFTTVKKVLVAIERSKGLVDPVMINQIEISIDFYPETLGHDARGRMYGVLARHFCPPPGTREISDDWPGFFPGPRPKRNYIVTRSLRDENADLWGRLRPEFDLPALYGSTFYVGRENHPMWSWRIQDKITDQRDDAAGTYLDLPEEKKRTRIEVTVGPQGCKRLGLTELSVLKSYRFTRLQAQLFKFMLPTFGYAETSGRPGQGVVRKKVMETMKQRFVNVGICGLQIMDEAREELRQQYLPDIRMRHKVAGTRMLKRKRSGSGRTGYLLAYEKLNSKVEHALRHLQERVWREMEK
jgi:hypothetical protein